MEIQLCPCGTFMANGWYMMDNMTWLPTYWLAPSGVGNWGVTVGIRAVVHGPCHRVCRVVWSTGSIRKLVISISIVLSEAERILIILSNLFAHCVLDWFYTLVLFVLDL